MFTILADNVVGRFVKKDGTPVKPKERGKQNLIVMGIVPDLVFHRYRMMIDNIHWKRQVVGRKISPYRNFVSAETGTFGIGLLGSILQYMNELGLQYNLIDKRVQFPVSADEITADMFGTEYKLRPYQVDATKICVNFQNGIVKKPTGSGKTIDLAALAMAFNKKLENGKAAKVLVLMDQKGGARQTVKQFIRYGIDPKDIVCVVGQSKSPKDDPYKWNEERLDRCPIIIAIRQMFKTLKKIMNKFDVILMDECHHACSKENRSLLKAAKRARVRIGFSGTPYTGDNERDVWRMSLFGPIIYEIPTRDLVEQEYLSKPFIKMMLVRRRDAAMFAANGYREIYQTGIINYDMRNFLITRLSRGLIGKTLILFLRVEHGDILMHKYGLGGRPAVNRTNPFEIYNKREDNSQVHVPKQLLWYLDGDWSVRNRERVLKSFNKQNHAILMASPIFDESIDLPGMNNLIIAGGEKSYVKTIQRLGRALRPNNSGVVHVFDFFDKSHEILERHAGTRKEIWVAEGHDVQVVMIQKVS